MEKLKKLILQKLKLNKIEVDEDTVDYIVGEVVQRVLNFCNLEKIPEALYYTVANIVVDYITNEYTEINKSAESVKIGDTTVAFKPTAKSNAIESFINDYYSDLYRFRKLVW